MSTTIGLFYGTTTGNTGDVAEQIAAALETYSVELHDIAEEGISAVADYDLLIMGIPTWDFGELQEDWGDLWDALAEIDLSGKRCALFGLGDQIGYGEWFLDAMGLLHDKLREQGASMLGYWPVAGYKFTESKALTEDGQQFVGLALDNDSQAAETDARIEQWVAQIVAEFGLN